MRVGMPDDVAAAYDRRDDRVQGHLMALRELVFEVADELGVTLNEALRWGEPAYLTKGGTTLRIDSTSPNTVSLFVNCQTDLVASWRARHGPALTYEGDRAVVCAVGAPLPAAILRDCIASALTYKLRKAAERRARR